MTAPSSFPSSSLRSFGMARSSLALLVACALLCPLLASAALSTPIDQSSFVWLQPRNDTVGRSANPGSPYLVLSLPLAVPSGRAYLYLTNLSPHPVSLEWDGQTLNSTAPLAAGETGGYNVDNCTASAQHRYAVWVGGDRVVAGSVDGLCLDCLLNITFTASNRTSTPTIQQPTYALQYRDRDDGATYTSDFVSPHYPSDQPLLAAAKASLPSLVLNFTFFIPILSFNFYPTSVLRLLPSSSSVTAPTSHYPAATAALPASLDSPPPLLHIPYYYTDIVNPSGSFRSGAVLTIIGGFSINPNDLYCCYINNTDNGFYSSCSATNSSNTFHCTIPRSVDQRGYDGEVFEVLAEYQPAKPTWARRGYYLTYLEPAGDNSFSVTKTAAPLAWWDIRGWTMRLIVIAGGLLLVATCVVASSMVWRRMRERKQHRAMERRASVSESGDGVADSPHWKMDTPYASPINPSINPSLYYLTPPDAFSLDIHPPATPPSPSTVLRHQLQAGIVPPSDSLPAFVHVAAAPVLHDPRLSPLRVKVKKGRRQVRAAAGGGAGRKLSDMSEPLLFATSI